MAIYAIGDLQGCYTDLQNLLNKLNFDSSTDTLWLAGDLVNRGPDSLKTLRFIHSLGDRAICVLGNHDLHLLAVAEGIKEAKDDGLDEIIEADDGDVLIDWLRHQPLLHHDHNLEVTMVHAGIYPKWSLQQAISHANELEQILRSEHYHDFLNVMYGNEPANWSNNLSGMDRLRFICNSLTRMRYVHLNGRLDLVDKGSPGSQLEDCKAWFDIPKRLTSKNPILFGHWSTLGQVDTPNIYPLDDGCVWGGKLTALRIDIQPMQYISIECATHKKPGEN